MMSSKMVTLGSLKINLFCNSIYDIIISDHDASNKMLSYDSNYIVGVLMWPKLLTLEFYGRISDNFNFIGI